MMRLRRFGRLFFWGSALLGTACGSGDPVEASPDVGGPYGVCGAFIQQFQVDAATHVAECSPLDDSVKPPYGGPHYPSWAAFQYYDFAVPHGYLIHAMEHGALVFYYNCADGCAAEVASAKQVIEAQAVDPLCTGTGTSRRAILVPDPTLDVQWAASAWGFTLRADCFDPDVFARFYQAHYAKGPENFCSPGVAFTSSPCP
ncbi:MAG: DUF3105 domain-containing protein [Polyangiaceae bacterium]